MTLRAAAASAEDPLRALGFSRPSSMMRSIRDQFGIGVLILVGGRQRGI